jgi:hypothetical protein
LNNKQYVTERSIFTKPLTVFADIPIEIEQAVDKIAVLSILDELLKSALTVNSFDELHQLLEQ